MASKYMDSYLISPAIRETQIRTTVRYHFTPTRVAIIKKTDYYRVLMEIQRNWNLHMLWVRM